MSALCALTLWLLGAAPVAKPTLLPKAGAHPASGVTQCAACHVTASWQDVRFNHDKTGFALKGQHAHVDCRACHLKDFLSPVARQCVGCHRDAHTQDLGSHCESCHNEQSWETEFTADAHRRTNFPLVGAHAVIPCQECHAEVRDRRFVRPTVSCATCHQNDVMRTFGTAVDHAALGFTQDCQQCHRPFAFKPARYPSHDSCFLISFGSHSAFSCNQCHTSLPSSTVAGSCSTGTAACASCHEHTCSQAGGQTKTDRQHAQVVGYQCQSRKCYECHQIGQRR